MTVRESIEERLRQIETEEDVCVVYACESGSRAWGFPSADSDYDVRFIYAHPTPWYLAINLERKRDVIERPIEGGLDVSGWDLRKALWLLRKGNPPLIEWLGSPIVYWDRFGVADRMRDLRSRYYSPVRCLYHYLHMARGNYRDYLKGSTVWVKKYFYVLRPLLAIRWIERDLGVVPTEFQVLIEGTVDAPELREEIDALVDSKRRGEELDRGPRIASISEFIESELARLEEERFEYAFETRTASVVPYNRLFRAVLDDVWS